MFVLNSSHPLIKEETILISRILIVEDSRIYRTLLKETLLSRFPSMEILEATNGQETMQLIDSSCPDLIFMDIKLPGENGIELTKKIKADCPQLIIIILTSYDLPEYREALSKYGANYFLSKGTTTKEEILTLVQSISSENKID